MNLRMRIAAACLAAIGMMPALWADVIVNPAETAGKVKVMNAVNNGPMRNMTGDQVRDNFKSYRNLRIPYARTHDAAFQSNYGGEHSVDISAIFPDFSAKAGDPKSYDFTLTDMYLKNIQDAGAKVFFRLGQKIEHNPKKYYIYPPKDFKKWAEVCEHIIRHYTEGWAEGHKWDIKYWEIWNEADLGAGDNWKRDPKTWGGTEQQFFEFYATVAKHLKKCFPSLKIGGPALAGNERWADDFLKYQQAANVPIDFFSWHIYATKPEDIAAKAGRMRAMMRKYGYGDAESILNEWNYVRNWDTQYPYSVSVINSGKGAAFTAAVMSACQEAPVDMLMYYDARYGTIFNGLWDFYDFSPTPTYYVFYAWAKLLDFGTAVRVSVDGGKDIYAVAAQKDGRTRVLVTRYSDDDNATAIETVAVGLAGGAIKGAVAHVTDGKKLYTEEPAEVKDGKVALAMRPNSFVMLEF